MSYQYTVWSPKTVNWQSKRLRDRDGGGGGQGIVGFCAE